MSNSANIGMCSQRVNNIGSAFLWNGSGGGGGEGGGDGGGESSPGPASY